MFPVVCSCDMQRSVHRHCPSCELLVIAELCLQSGCEAVCVTVVGSHGMQHPPSLLRVIVVVVVVVVNDNSNLFADCY